MIKVNYLTIDIRGTCVTLKSVFKINAAVSSFSISCRDNLHQNHKFASRLHTQVPDSMLISEMSPFLFDHGGATSYKQCVGRLGVREKYWSHLFNLLRYLLKKDEKKIVFAEIGQCNVCEKSLALWLAAEEELFTKRRQKRSKLSP